jgi:tetratricopeptide (TPR) repeat protein
MCTGMGIVSAFLFVTAVSIFVYVRGACRRMEAEGDVRRMRLVVLLALLCVVAPLGALLVATTVKDVACRSFFAVLDALLLAIAGWIVSDMLRLERVLCRTPGRLLGMVHIEQYCRSIQSEDAEGALRAAQEACRTGESNPLAWLVMANFAIYHEDRLDKAEQCIDRAAALMKGPDPWEAETRAYYETCKGNLLLEREEYASALVHLKRALELRPTKERSDYVHLAERFVAQQGHSATE